MKPFLTFILGCMTMCIQAQKISSADQMQNDTIALHEIVVSASQPITKFEGDGILTRVAGTKLSELGMAKDVLGYMPGVIVANGNVEVVGKGAPTFYINGRKMRNSSELDQIRSEKIKDITVINNPGARYSGETTSVIRITTVKEVGDGFALDNKATVGVSDYAYGKDQLWMNYRMGKVDVFSTMEYDNKKTKERSEAVQDSWGTTHTSSEISSLTNSRSQLYEGQIGFNAQLDDKNEIGAYYQIDHRPLNGNGLGENNIFFDDALSTTTHSGRHFRNRYTNHSIEAYINGDWGKWWFESNISTMWRINNNHKTIIEKNLSTNVENLYNFSNKNHGRMIAVDALASRSLWKSASIDIGACYTNSNRNDDFTTSGLATIKDESNRIKESDIAIFTEISFKIGKAKLKGGLRYEHINSDYYEFGHKINEQSRKYDEFLPSISIGLPVGRAAALQMSYTRKYRRPTYGQLSATTNYVNPYLYESGNPLLKSINIDNISLDFKYRWLILQAFYQRVSKLILSEAIPLPLDPEITLLRKENAGHNQHKYQIVASVMPGFIAKKWYPVFMAGVMGQSFKVDFRDHNINMNTPMWIMRLNNIIVLPERFMLNLNASWRSHGESENIDIRSTWQIDLTLSKTINSHLDVKISANDLFNTARKTRATLYSGQYSIYNEKISTTRFVELTVGYKFNVTKSKYKGTGAAKSEKDRF